MNRTLNILKCLLLMVVIGALIVPSATAGTLYPDDTLGDHVAGNVSTHEIGFYLDSSLPADGKIKTGFSPGFDTSLFTNDTEVIVNLVPWGEASLRLTVPIPGREILLPTR